MDNKKNLEQTFKAIQKKIDENNLKVSNFKQIDYGIQFLVGNNNWSELIRIYQNKKGELKFDYSQIKNPNRIEIIQNIIECDKISSAIFNDIQINVDLDSPLGFPIIGTDESGKGDYFGPLVTAGVYVDDNSAKKLLAIGVKDSKKLNDSSIQKIARKIQETCRGKYSIIEISPERYNSLYEQFRKENKNLNTLLAWGHAKAIEEILTNIECDKAISDQFADEHYILGKLQERGRKIKLIQMPKAEQNIAVAAASILARDRFVDKLEKLSTEYEINLPKGASSLVIESGKKFVDRYGRDELEKVAKMHFKTTERVIKKR